MAETLQVPARRWLQFRLRTLLLAPVFILLLQVFSDQLFDHLIWLWCAYGAMFGVAWAVGRMRIVGLRQTGLARVLPVAKAAIDGGMIGGALLGAPVLWTALWRSGAWRYFNTRGIASDAWEIFTSGVAGYWCGGFAGALAGGACGTAAAYLVCFAARAFRAEYWMQPSASDEVATQVITNQTVGSCLLCRKVLATSLAFGPPILVAVCLWGDWTEQKIIDRLRPRGLRSQQPASYGPRWFKQLNVPGYELACFRRGGVVHFAGRIDAKTFDDFMRLSEVHTIHFEVETDADVIAAAELLRQRPNVHELTLTKAPCRLWFHRGDALNFSGLTALETLHAFARLSDVRTIDFRLETDADLIVAADFLRRRPKVQASLTLMGQDITDDGLKSLEGLPNLGRLDLSSTSITDASIDFIKSLANLKGLVARSNSRLSKEGETKLFLAIPTAVIKASGRKSVRFWMVRDGKSNASKALKRQRLIEK
jgi:hypothetical protein